MTSFHRPAFVSISSTSALFTSAESLVRENFSPDRTFSSIVMAGNGFGFWKTMPMWRRASVARRPPP